MLVDPGCCHKVLLIQIHGMLMVSHSFYFAAVDKHNLLSKNK